MSIQDKVVIVTGASSGIGAATTRILARQGAKLITVARRRDRLEAIRNELPDADIRIAEADVTDPDAMKEVAVMALDAHGRIDALYNNAGIMPINALSQFAHDEWRRTLDVNVMGVLNGISAVLPAMIEQKSGHIIATDSVLGHVVVPDLAVYCGTKFAIRAIMEGLRQEQHGNGIKTSIVSPGVVRTEIFNSTSNSAHRQEQIETEEAIGLDPEQVARAVAFALDAPADVDVNEIVVRPLAQPM
ncbi:SDR family oxidoreductase [Bifidobacterium cuniculi]|uniref:2-hydroxycyclohexanecarboxyl-CoA dehydrogenase n=1 Tax=Bifidobacterium cuniculi TaxID=1688 RepID=A0A087ATI9_9BIFI|nr:SDR family oxidoreductase [Bifidobacterium cuniculi]KFI62089.1 2-hydroxycyclohexanecarboxyl-CoA dehydrogenase [Bifidobacterium cuniculi]